MRYIRYACIAIFGLAIISIALANRGMVSLRVLPVEIADWFALNPQIELPLFIVIMASVLAGLLVGFIWEWIREHGERAEKARLAKERRRLEREVARLKGEKHQGKDEVLALLDETG